MASAAAPALKRRAKAKVYDSTEEIALIRRAKKDDQAAFTELYYRYVAKVRNVILRIVRDDDIADWRTNIAFTSVLEHLRGWTIKEGKRVKVPVFDEQSKFGTWLIRIAINEGLMHLRKQKTSGGLTDSLDEMQQPSSSIDREDNINTKAQRILAQRDLTLEGIADRQVLNMAFERVPVKFKLALHLRYWEGMSIDEIKGVLQETHEGEVTVPYVKTLLHRGKWIMRKQIQVLSTPRVKRF